MSRAHPAALAAAGALGACLTFTALAPAATDAGPEAAAPPAARAGPVAFDTELVEQGGGRAVRIRARNGGGREQGCRVQATVVRERGDPRSRVLAVPEPVWQDAVVLRVPARGERVRNIPLPASAASPSGAQQRVAVQETLRVVLRPECSADAGVG